MFGRKDDYQLHNALEKVRTLTNDVEWLQRHVGKLTQQVEQNTNHGKKNSKEIQRLFVSFGYSQSVREFKSFNLSEKIEAVLQHLGLTESITLGNKLVPASKKKAEKK